MLQITMYQSSGIGYDVVYMNNSTLSHECYETEQEAIKQIKKIAKEL